MGSPKQISSHQSLWSKVWRNSAPTKVKCFTCLVTRRACLTHEVLKRKGRIIVSWCSLRQRQRRPRNVYFCIATSQQKFGSPSLVSQRQSGPCLNILLTVELLDKKRGKLEPESVVEDNPTLHLLDNTGGKEQ